MKNITKSNLLPLLLFFVTVLYGFYAVINEPRSIVIVVFGILIVGIGVLVGLKAKLNSTLLDTVLQRIGFTAITDPTVLSEYSFGRQFDMIVHRVYQSHTAPVPYTLIKFSLTKGIGKQKVTRLYIGCEYITHVHHRAVQLYDQTNPFQRRVSQDHQLESSEFNRLFNIYSTDPSAPFYFLDPDTMSDLIDLKAKTGSSINMESFKNRIFVYTDATEVTKLFVGGFTFREIIQGSIRADKLGLYQQSVEKFIAQLHDIFAALDYKLKI